MLVQVSGVEEGNGGGFYLHALLSASCFDCTVRTYICVWGQWSDTYLEISGYQDPLLTGNKGSSLLAS